MKYSLTKMARPKYHSVQLDVMFEGVGRPPDASELADGVKFNVKRSVSTDSEGEPLSQPSLADVVPIAVAREAVECEARMPSVHPDLVVEAEDQQE